MQIGLHTLRHQHATESLSAGGKLAAVSTRLGHASTAVTGTIYAHAYEEDERGVAKQWDAAFGGALRLQSESVRKM